MDNSIVLLVHVAIVAIAALIGFCMAWFVRPWIARKKHEWTPGRYYWVAWLLFGTFWTWYGTREMELSGLALARSGLGGAWFGIAISDLVILRRNKV